jgi:hypothetical protein
MSSLDPPQSRPGGLAGAHHAARFGCRALPIA